MSEVCLSELLEKGMKRMEVLGIQQGREEVFAFPYDFMRGRHSDNPYECCALGAIYLGATERVPANQMTTFDVVGLLRRSCPAMNMELGMEIATLNDRQNKSLPDILAWLKEHGY